MMVTPVANIASELRNSFWEKFGAVAWRGIREVNIDEYFSNSPQLGQTILR
jgi:hypothetical protein